MNQRWSLRHRPLENRSYEGVNWQAIHLTDEGARDGGALWLYLCAF